MTGPTEHFDNLLKCVSALEPRCQVAFAAACAERLSHVPDVSVVTEASAALARLWEDLEGGRQLNDATVSELVLACEKLVASEDELNELKDIIRDDALAAVIFALRTRQDGNAQNAVWAARRVWDSIDYYVSNHVDSELLGQDLVRKEVERQTQDLRQLKAERDFVVRLRARAQAQGAALLLQEGQSKQPFPHQ